MVQQLPTREKIFANALGELDKADRALGDAADWLRSDWSPVGSSLTNVQSAARASMFERIEAAKRQINWAKDDGEEAVR